MYNKPIVPDTFQIPLIERTSRCLFRPLTVRDVTRDFDAVMSSREYLIDHFKPETSWPDGLTIEQNLIDLGWHEYEFQNHTSFAYTITDLTDELTLGCCYIYPSQLDEHEVSVSYWVRSSELNTGLSQHVAKHCNNGFQETGPLKTRYSSIPHKYLFTRALNLLV